MRLLKQSTARDILVFMVDATDNASGLAGLTLTITASKNAAAFASISPTVTDRSNGWYKLELTTSHTDTLGDLALNITATGAIPTTLVMQVCVEIPGGDTSNISAIKAKTDNLPSDPADQSAVEAAISTAKSIPKNTQLTAWPFAMFDEDGLPATGLSVAVEVSKDGGAFASSANSASEISDGWYKITFSSTEMNCDHLAARASASGANETLFVITTEG